MVSPNNELSELKVQVSDLARHEMNKDTLIVQDICFGRELYNTENRTLMRAVWDKSKMP